MPITSSAKKANRQGEKKQVYNLRRVRLVKDSAKEIENLLKEGKIKEAKALLPQAYKAIDKAAKMNTLKDNTAARRKSRLARIIKKADTAK